MSAFYRFFPTLAGLTALLFGLVGTPAAGTPETGASEEATTYHATLAPLNSDANGGDASGEATFTVSDDDLTIEVTMDGVAPDIAHLQHFHGFAASDETATCPTMDADTNGDGVVDLIETEPFVGTTMVPFTDDPVSMEIVDATYPTADADGSYTYEQTVSLSDLEAAFADAFPDQQLDLDKRAVMIHTVPESTGLPDTAESMGDIPAQVTLPIACGEIEMVGNGTPQATPV